MKESFITGALSGVGTFLMVLTGTRHGAFTWTECGFVIGTVLVVIGGIHMARVIREGLG